MTVKRPSVCLQEGRRKRPSLLISESLAMVLFCMKVRKMHSTVLCVLLFFSSRQKSRTVRESFAGDEVSAIDA